MDLGTADEALARALDNLLRHHNTFHHGPCEFGREALAAIHSVTAEAADREAAGTPGQGVGANRSVLSAAADPAALADAIEAQMKDSAWQWWLQDWQGAGPARPEFRRNAYLALAEGILARLAGAPEERT